MAQTSEFDPTTQVKTCFDCKMFDVAGLLASMRKWSRRDVSVEVAERIAAPQRSSTRTIYKLKWALFEKWCRENSVDFSSHSVQQVSDSFMYLSQDLNRRPSTIGGYRTAIVDTLGPAGLHISQSSDLNRSLSTFHRDHPKSSKVERFCCTQ